MRFPHALVAVTISALSCSTAIAEIYKYVAEDGSVTFSESRPVDSKVAVEVLHPDPRKSRDAEAVSDRLNKRAEAFNERREAEQEEAKKIAEAEAADEKKRAACDSARRRVASLSRPRVNAVDDSGQRTRMSEEWRQEQLAEAKEAVAEFCE
ncbi:MAG: DUF4124 domain-containing protein [Gammaproteobacteria bacterium]